MYETSKLDTSIWPIRPGGIQPIESGITPASPQRKRRFQESPPPLFRIYLGVHEGAGEGEVRFAIIGRLTSWVDPSYVVSTGCACPIEVTDGTTVDLSSDTARQDALSTYSPLVAEILWDFCVHLASVSSAGIGADVELPMQSPDPVLVFPKADEE